jgi:hypothetical protein
MVYLENAYFGDEKSFQDITAFLGGKVSGGVLDVTADEKLIPAFEVAQKTELSNKDDKVIRDQAVKLCSEADQKCLDATMSKLRQERLQEKQRETLNPATTIKGRRLTVNVRDDQNKLRTLVVPDGQKFKLEGITTTDPKNKDFQLPSASDIQEKSWIVLGVIAGAFVYVFSIAAVYAIFMREALATGKDYFRMVAYGATGLSVLIPYSGLVIAMFWFGMKAFTAEFTRV